MVIDLEQAPFVVQNWNDGVWRDLGGIIIGKTAAIVKLQDLLGSSHQGKFRAIGKNEADKYREGLNAARELLRRQKRRCG